MFFCNKSINKLIYIYIYTEREGLLGRCVISGHSANSSSTIKMFFIFFSLVPPPEKEEDLVLLLEGEGSGGFPHKVPTSNYIYIYIYIYIY